MGLETLPIKASDRKKFSQVIMRRWVRVDRAGQASIMQVGWVLYGALCPNQGMKVDQSGV